MGRKMRGGGYIAAENRFCAASTAAMGLNASLDGVSSLRSGVLLSVDKSLSARPFRPLQRKLRA